MDNSFFGLDIDVILFEKANIEEFMGLEIKLPETIYDEVMYKVHLSSLRCS